MRKFCCRVAVGSLCLMMLLSLAQFARAADTLNWNTSQSRVDADIKSWTLPHLLEQVATRTGWRVYLEPGVSREVSARFKNQTPGDALRLLIGDLNFALVPETNGSSRLFIFRTGRENATQLINPAGKDSQGKIARHVLNELIVTLKPGEKIEDLARLVGAKVVGKIDGINAYRLQFSDEASANSALLLLGSNPAVAGIDYNYIVDPPPTPLGLVSTTVPPVQLKLVPPAGNGQVIVGLPDTGLQSMGSDLDKFILKSLSVVGDATLDPNSPSHGTSMAEAILRGAAASGGGSSSMQIVSVDVYGPNPTTTMFDVAAGIVQAVNNGANVINLSLGGQGDSQFLHTLIQQVTARGIPVFAAAGNDGSAETFYPAAYPEVTAVTASSQGKIAAYANYGSFVDVMAPGTTVVYLNNASFIVSGTSTSTALVSGLTAGLATSKNLSVSDAANAVKTSPAFKPPATP